MLEESDPLYADWIKVPTLDTNQPRPLLCLFFIGSSSSPSMLRFSSIDQHVVVLLQIFEHFQKKPEEEAANEDNKKKVGL